MRHALKALLVLFLIGAASAPAVAERVRGTQFEKLSTTDSLGRAITYYLSDSATPKPLALVIQGSGCNALFRRIVDGSMSAVGYHNVFRSVGGERYRVLAVEKPGAQSTSEQPVGGGAEGCPQAFLEEHTVERWAEALVAALAAARLQAGVIDDRTLVIGHSEGGVLAARVARLDPKIRHAALLASPGPDPAEELILWGETRQRPRAETVAMIERIRARPDSTSDFVLGHPYRRWSSFLAADPAADLLASPANIFLAHGDKDTNWPVAAHEGLARRLKAAARMFFTLRIGDADHALMRPGQKPPEGMVEAFKTTVFWTKDVP
jgi:pimeloyl-ACP methyl ester carboxylesterase